MFNSADIWIVLIYFILLYIAEYNNENELSYIHSEESVELVERIAERKRKRRSFSTEYKLQVITMAIKDKTDDNSRIIW